MVKERVAPKKFVSIARLELAAAVLSVTISNMIKKELHLQELDEYFWTDSRVVLGYIATDTRAFKTFVANRLQKIQENSNVEQCTYVHQGRLLQMMLPEVWILKNLILIDRFRLQNSCGSHSHHGRQFQFQYYCNQKIQNWRNKWKQKRLLLKMALGNIEEKYSYWLKMKWIIALMLKWKINTEQKKQMMPRRSEKVLDFSINNLIY